MARIGFKKTLVTGQSGVTRDALFALLKTWLANAGFNVLADDADHFEFMPANLNPADHTDDDTGHYHLYRADNFRLDATVIHGPGYADPGTHTGVNAWIYCDADQYYNYRDLANATIANPPLVMYFGADGGAGWWWTAGYRPVKVWNVAGDAEILVRQFSICASAQSTRLPGDLHQNIMSRIGLCDEWGGWQNAYHRLGSDGSYASDWHGCWSPLGGNTWSCNTWRHAGSPLPPLFAPVYPAIDAAQSPALTGALDNVMIATNGWALTQEVVPGWVAMCDGDNPEMPMILLRHPGTFTDLDL